MEMQMEKQTALLNAWLKSVFFIQFKNTVISFFL